MYRGGPLMTQAAEELHIDEKLRLRHVTIEDAGELFALVDENREYLKEWFPWVGAVRSVADEEKALAFFVKQRLDGRGAFWIVELATHPERFTPIGMVGINYVDQHNGNCVLGYWIAQKEERKGKMRQSLRRVIDYCFQELKLHRIAMQMAVGNKPSERVAEVLGFKKEGVMKEKEWHYDHFVDVGLYAITAPEWRLQSMR